MGWPAQPDSGRSVIDSHRHLQLDSRDPLGHRIGACVAPGATILLVEAVDATWSSLGAAIDYARQQPGVSAISMSWGGGEDAGTPSFDSHFATPDEHANVAFFAAAGNSGALASILHCPTT